MEIINQIKKAARRLFRGVGFSAQSDKSVYRTRSVKDGKVTYDYHEIGNKNTKGLIDGAEDQTQQTISRHTLPDMSFWQDRFASISKTFNNFDLESCNTIESDEPQEDKPSYKPPNRQEAFGPLFRKKGQRY